METVKFRRLSEKALLPTRATEGSACFDLYADTSRNYMAESPLFSPSLPPYLVATTGIGIELPPGHVGLICSRSGLAARDGLFVLNAPGVIDADYRGELKVILGWLPISWTWPEDSNHIRINHGMRIAQLMILPLTNIRAEEVDALSETARGTNGLGSTGV